MTRLLAAGAILFGLAGCTGRATPSTSVTDDAGPGAADSGTRTATTPPAPPPLVLLVADGPSHGPGEHEYRAGALILAGLLARNGVRAEVVTGGWFADPSVIDSARAIVFLTSGNVYHPLLAGGRLDELSRRMRPDLGLGLLHWSVHFPGEPDARVLEYFGGHYSDAISTNPVWTARFTALPDHPVTRGVAPFELLDEWYYNLAFAPARVTPILAAAPPDDTRRTAAAASHPGRAETVCWVHERRDGGRAFGFTGMHFHRNWGSEPFRRTIANAALWIAGREVPPAGADVTLDPADLTRNLDPK